MARVPIYAITVAISAKQTNDARRASTVVRAIKREVFFLKKNKKIRSLIEFVSIRCPAACASGCLDSGLCECPGQSIVFCLFLNKINIYYA